MAEQLDVYSVWENKSPVASVQYVDFKPIAPVQQNCCIEFQIPPSQNSYVDLKHSFLQVKALLVKSDGSPITESDMGVIGVYDNQGNKLTDEQLAAEEQKKVCPANLLLSSIFSQCDITTTENHQPNSWK